MTRTAWLFPGLNGIDHPDELAPLLALPPFRRRWQLVQRGFADAPGFAAFDAGLQQGAALQREPRSWPWQALAVAAMQQAMAESLQARGHAAQWLSGYSIGDLGRALHAGVVSFARCVAFAAALPPLPVGTGTSLAVLLPPTLPAAAVATSCTRTGVACSRLSDRLLLIAGPAQPVEAAAVALSARGCRVRRLAACALHAPVQRPLATLLARRLRRAAMRPPTLPMFSSLSLQPLHQVEQVRRELAQNVAAACDFATAVRRLHHDHGVDTFVDLGPGRHAQRFVEHCRLPVRVLSALDLLRQPPPYGARRSIVAAAPARMRHGSDSSTAAAPGRRNATS